MDRKIPCILDRVHKLYQKYGIKSVTMDDVSKELGISKKTLYHYFSDKNDLVQKNTDRVVNQSMEKFEEILSRNLNAIEELFELNRLANEMMKDYSPAIEFDLKKYYPQAYEMIRQVKTERMYNIILKNIVKGKVEGVFRHDLKEDIIARMHITRMMSGSDDPLFTHEELHSPSFFREFFVYHIRGIANEKGLSLLEKYLKIID